jgi:hypothetical protein
MTKGIREYTNARFAENLPKLTELGATGFRKAVMDAVIAQFTISVASAATHYNHALKEQRKTDPKSVEGVGRPEDKKGGRPVLNPVTVVKAKSGEVVVEGVSRGKATEMIQKAAAKKGVAKLAIKEDLEAAKAKAEAEAAEAAKVVETPVVVDTPAAETKTVEVPAGLEVLGATEVVA